MLHLRVDSERRQCDTWFPLKFRWGQMLRFGEFRQLISEKCAKKIVAAWGLNLGHVILTESDTALHTLFHQRLTTTKISAEIMDKATVPIMLFLIDRVSSGSPIPPSYWDFMWLAEILAVLSSFWSVFISFYSFRLGLLMLAHNSNVVRLQFDSIRWHFDQRNIFHISSMWNTLLPSFPVSMFCFFFFITPVLFGRISLSLLLIHDLQFSLAARCFCGYDFFFLQSAIVTIFLFRDFSVCDFPCPILCFFSWLSLFVLFLFPTCSHW
jgi:hypothetical protein